MRIGGEVQIGRGPAQVRIVIVGGILGIGQKDRHSICAPVKPIPARLRRSGPIHMSFMNDIAAARVPDGRYDGICGSVDRRIGTQVTHFFTKISQVDEPIRGRHRICCGILPIIRIGEFLDVGSRRIDIRTVSPHIVYEVSGESIEGRNYRSCLRSLSHGYRPPIP